MKIQRKHSKNRIAVFLFLALCIYYFSVDYAYNNFMLTRWGDDFLETSWGQYASPNPYHLLLPVFLVSAFLISIIIDDRPSDFFHLLCFLTPVTPMLIIAENKDVGELFALFALFAFFISFTISRLKFSAPFFYFNLSVFKAKNFAFFTIVLGLMIVVIALLKGGGNYVNFNFSDVYTYRRAASDTRGTLLNYALLNYIGILLPLGFAVALERKQAFLFIALFTINVILFGLTSNKSYFFIWVFTFLIFIILKLKNSTLILVISMASVCVSLTVLYIFAPSLDIFGTLYIRRFFFVPAYANFQYWEFFLTHPHAYWSDSKLSFGLVDSVYGRPTPRIIADYYSGVDFTYRVEKFSNSNTGWFGSGFANAGYAGMVFYAVLSGVVTKYGNLLSEYVGRRVATAGLSFYFFSTFFTSTDLPAALLSYGMFSLIFIMILWGSPNTPNILNSNR